MIRLNKFVKPDFVTIIPVKDYNGDLKYEKHSISFVESINVIVDCDEEGNSLDSYGHRFRYHACRLAEGQIELCTIKEGWVPAFQVIQTAYDQEIADNILLEKE